MQKQLSRRTTWLLKTAYWLGYGSIPTVGTLVYYLYQARLAEGAQSAVFFCFYVLHIFFSSVLGNWLVGTTGHSQARLHEEIWRRTPGLLPTFPALEVGSDMAFAARTQRRDLLIAWLIALGFIAYNALSAPTYLVRSLVMLSLPLVVFLLRTSPAEAIAWAGPEGVRGTGSADAWGPWEELARVEVRLEYDYLGDPKLLALSLFDVFGKSLGQVWLDTERARRPERASLERFYEALREEFAVEVVS
ncbi:hypothetical protein [Armatimonas rosea]|uniref:Uncharacterized protein n=1 Tax=Armatimonas rosea TaxID=685828 RepID=A0A7W9SPY9_ARMRO|nr:hypothetical protein [Armatimonas rosea]MBB6050320.1 hypothetical protein [Armatimonas rosea]